MVAVAAGTPKPKLAVVVTDAGVGGRLPKVSPPPLVLAALVPKENAPAVAAGALLAGAPNNPKVGGLAVAVASPPPVLLEN